MFNGPHPETGEDLFVAEEAHPEGAPPFDLPSQTAVFAPGPDPEMLAEVSAKLRKAAGLPAKPKAVVANKGKSKSKSKTNGNGVVDKVKDAVSLTRAPPQVTARPHPTRRSNDRTDPPR